MRIKQPTKQGYIEVSDWGIFDASYPTSKTRRGRVQGRGEITPTLTAQGIENLLIVEPTNRNKNMEVAKLQLAIELEDRMYFRLPKEEVVFATENARPLFKEENDWAIPEGLETVNTGYALIAYLPEEKIGTPDLQKGIYLLYDPETSKYYRLRKLIPRECSRLMGNPDSYTDLIEGAGICKSKQYQLYGNSIVVPCLMGIFRNLIFGCEKPEGLLF